MTNAQKREVLVSMDILREAHEEIEKTLRKKDRIMAQSILAECQETAAALGEYIERFEGKDHAAISCLEEYCEILFQIYKELDGDVFSESRICKRLKKQLIKIKNSAKNDIHARLQIVFFPYKAAMWDSLESVYLSAKADAGCDVYCVPIPYYDLNSDHSFGQMHYEGEEYPDYVQVLDWQSYDFEHIKPDVAYIHNPYDDCNLVTSVHPKFYSGHLKKYIETLVYIPYYATGGMIAKMHRFLPAYFNMDHIIVQHERQIPLFIPEISRKIRALGSPKFDKVINRVITDEMIPEEWKPKIKDLTLFLNTGINGLLEHNEKSLLKVQYILDVAEREKVTLLWRPHPLLEATIRSLRPELWQVYQETVKKVQGYENGILDQTGNAELAVKLSDAYIGEATSSVSHLFGVLGKPLFFVRQNILREESDLENIKIVCCAADRSSSQLWAFAATRNALLKISGSGAIEEFYLVPGEKDKNNLYSDILIHENKVYLIPRNAREIAVFDIIEKSFTKLGLPESEQKDKFNRGYLYQDKIYMVPRCYKKMAVLSCTDTKLFFDGAVVEELKGISGLSDLFVSVNGSRLIGDSIYFAAPNKPCLLEYDLRTGNRKMNRIAGTNKGFSCIERVSDKIVLGSMKGSEVIVWDPGSGNSTTIRAFPEGWKIEEKPSFWDIIELNGEAYFFPRKNSMILRLSVKDCVIGSVEKGFPFSIKERRSPFFNHSNHFLFVRKLSDGRVMVQDANRHGISEFHADGSFEWRPVALREEDELKAFGGSFSRQGENLPWGLYESRYHSVRHLISYLRKGMHDEGRQKKAFSSAAANLDGTAGQKIHAYVMGKVKK